MGTSVYLLNKHYSVLATLGGRTHASSPHPQDNRAQDLKFVLKRSPEIKVE